jgi:hypothetical protein
MTPDKTNARCEGCDGCGAVCTVSSVGMSLGAVLLILLACITVMIAVVTCCVIRCFRPEGGGAKGAEWVPAKRDARPLVEGGLRSDRSLGDTPP